MFTVIAFDISDDRTRYRVVKVLRRYALRAQKSVFEAPKLAPNHFQRLREEIEGLIDLRTDRVRYYFLCESCRVRIESSGQGKVAKHREYQVV